MGRHAASGDDENELKVTGTAAATEAAAGVDVAQLAEQVTKRLPVPVFAPLSRPAEAARPLGSRPLPRPRGRHAHPDDVDDVDDLADEQAEADVDTKADVDTQADVDTKAEADTKAEVGAPRRREGATAADLRLLRTEPALRHRVIAAVLVPFVLYFAVLLAIGRTDAFAVWVWLPLIAAGIGGGLLLDSAHAKLKKARN